MTKGKLALDYMQSLRDTFVNDMKEVGAEDIALFAADILTDWKFFEMPASSKHHGNTEGGLFLHSEAVAHELKRITDATGVKWQNPRSPILIGYFHDLCKCNSYRRSVTVKTVSESKTTVDTSIWEYCDNNRILTGHGDKSVMLASLLCRLTEEEMLCIRYHMGAYETDDWSSFDRAIRKYETVLWTHQADMLASKVLNI